MKKTNKTEYVKVAITELDQILTSLNYERVSSDNIMQVINSQRILATIGKDPFWRTEEGENLFREVCRANMEDREVRADEKPEPKKAAAKADNNNNNNKGFIKHEKYDKILDMVRAGLNPYLYGPAGTGKTTIAQQIAKDLGLKFYMTNAVQNAYDLAGFVDANGTYNDTPFYHAFSEGGVFLFDEMDGSAPDALNLVNSALANGYYNVPKYGLIKAHPDFHVIGAGNTLGTGADEMYVSRSVLDMATLDRFTPLEFGYCRDIEMLCAHGDDELVNFVYDLRNTLAEQGISYVVSPRAITKFVKLSACNSFTPEEAMIAAFVGYLNKDDRMILANNLTHTRNRYAQLLKRAI